MGRAIAAAKAVCAAIGVVGAYAVMGTSMRAPAAPAPGATAPTAVCTSDFGPVTADEGLFIMRADLDHYRRHRQDPRPQERALAAWDAQSYDALASRVRPALLRQSRLPPALPTLPKCARS